MQDTFDPESIDRSAPLDHDGLVDCYAVCREMVWLIEDSRRVGSADFQNLYMRAKAAVGNATAGNGDPERERCARIAEVAVAEAGNQLAIARGDESWVFAMNEMTSDVNERFNAALDCFRDIPRRIRDDSAPMVVTLPEAGT
jgi:hypothetical protein